MLQQEDCAEGGLRFIGGRRDRAGRREEAASGWRVINSSLMWLVWCMEHRLLLPAHLRRERIFIELMTSDSIFRASREGSK